nr:MAG TPA: hypothetical protein [Caudoviricetes sp.]
MEWLFVIAVIWRLSIQTAEVISNYKIEMKKLELDS